ncbi:MAG: HAD family hydrolase [Candidatus Methanofastidiosia archaeon]
MVQAVTFDLWDTLVLSSAEYHQNLQKKRIELMYNALNGISKEYIAQALEKSWIEIEIIRKTLRDVPTHAQIDILKKYIRLDNCTNDALEKAYTEAVLYNPPRLNPYAHEVLSAIPVEIGLISNTGRTPGKVLRPLLSHLGVLHLFGVMVFSNEVGYLKPHPKIFTHTARMLDVPVSEIVHVGDDVTADIYGAQSAGMKTVLIKECADLIQVKEMVS